MKRTLSILAAVATALLLWGNLAAAGLATLHYGFVTSRGWVDMNPDLDIQGAGTFAAHLGAWAPDWTLAATVAVAVAAGVLIVARRRSPAGWLLALLAAATVLAATANRLSDHLFNDSMGLLLQPDRTTLTVAAIVAAASAVALPLCAWSRRRGR